jgi:hypothetical protein
MTGFPEVTQEHPPGLKPLPFEGQGGPRAEARGFYRRLASARPLRAGAEAQFFAGADGGPATAQRASSPGARF